MSIEKAIPVPKTETLVVNEKSVLLTKVDFLWKNQIVTN